MRNTLSRRSFLQTSAAVSAAIFLPASLHAEGPAFPLIDYHAHPDGFSIDDILAIGEKRGVKLGIVEHAGTKENKYPVVLSNDEELRGWIKKLKGRNCFAGVQAEWVDWMSVFSKEAVAELDYVLSDAMTFRDKGKKVHLWKAEEVKIDDAQDFMDRYVDFHVEVMSSEPIDILANTTFLPEAIVKQYDELWTEKRMKIVIDAAVKHKVALEISGSYKIPTDKFLQLAKAAGVTFSFGSNGRGQNIGKLDYCVEMARKLELNAKNLFTPAPAGKKPIQVRK